MFTQTVKTSNNKLSFLLYFALTIGLLAIITGCGQTISTAGLDGPVPAGNIYLAWNPPTHNIDETPIDIENELIGYRVYYGKQSGVYTSVFTVSDPSTTSCIIAAEPDEQLFFVLTALNIFGNESGYSPQISKVAM